MNISERKAKEAEAAMREIARAAREAHRRNADLDSTPAPPTPQGESTHSRVVNKDLRYLKDYNKTRCQVNKLTST